jgi:predicted porin
MKKVLLGTSALLGAGLVASPAFAADGIKLELGGFFQTAVLGNWDDHQSGDAGNKRYNDGVFSDAEVYFKGKTTLDNGLTVGARIELEGEQSGDQIDAAYVYFQGGFGEVRIGSQNSALANACVTPVGGTANFGAFSQDQVPSNIFRAGMLSSHAVCGSLVDKSQKIVYITPNFGGFQLNLSWTPNGSHESSGVTGFHSGMPDVVDNEPRNVVDAYASFSHDFSGWSLSWGGGGQWQLSTGGTQTGHKAAIYQTGLNLTFGSLSVGGVFEYDNNTISHTDDAWTAGGGVAYNVDAWTVGLQYAHSHGSDPVAGEHDLSANTLALTGKYDMGPGIALDGTLQYSWGNPGGTFNNSYDAVSVGLGTAFTF